MIYRFTNINDKNKNIVSIYYGPPKYNTYKHKNYIENPEWDSIDLGRNSHHVYNFVDQGRDGDVFFSFISTAY